MTDFLWHALLIGIGATAILDLWALFLKAAFSQPLPNWGLVGRWFAHIPRGTLFHADIASARPVANETAIGWIAHFLTGIVYAGLLIALAGREWVANPTFMPALIVGLVTVGAGWFLLQPGMGAGWAASLRPNPWKVRGLNLVSHAVFGTGLFITALLLSSATA
jgi:Protein of unknown function (DUF2938)